MDQHQHLHGQRASDSPSSMLTLRDDMTRICDGKLVGCFGDQQRSAKTYCAYPCRSGLSVVRVLQVRQEVEERVSAAMERSTLAEKEVACVRAQAQQETQVKLPDTLLFGTTADYLSQLRWLNA